MSSPPGNPDARDREGATRTADAGPRPDRLRATLRRHGLVRRPRPIRDFLAREGVRFTEGNRVEVFEDGAAGLAAMLAAIERAEKRIHLETYIYRSDATGRRFADALEARARAGVAVRVLYDAIGSLTLDTAIFRGLRAAGGEIVAFNPIRGLYPRWLPRRRDHRKLLIVDGAIGFTGGLNIGDEYDKGPDDGIAHWRDTHLAIEGPAVRDLEAVFLESWFRADAPNLPWTALLAEEPSPRGDIRCAVVPDGPVYRRRMMRDLFLIGMYGSTRQVDLTSPYFAPDRRVLRALSVTSGRGLRISLILAGYTDHPILRRAARNLIPRLLATGVEVFEHHAAMLHAKSAVFDSRWVVVGTSNLDRQSFQHSYEVNLILEGGDIAQRLQAIFQRDRARSTRIDEGMLARRGWAERLLDRASAVILRLI